MTLPHMSFRSDCIAPLGRTSYLHQIVHLLRVGPDPLRAHHYDGREILSRVDSFLCALPRSNAGFLCFASRSRQGQYADHSERTQMYNDTVMKVRRNVSTIINRLILASIEISRVCIFFCFVAFVDFQIINFFLPFLDR